MPGCTRMRTCPNKLYNNQSTTQIVFPYRVNFLLPNETLSEIEAKRFTESQKIRRHELNCKISSSKLFLDFLLIYVLSTSLLIIEVTVTFLWCYLLWTMTWQNWLNHSCYMLVDQMPAVPTLSRLMDWKPFAFAFAVDYVGVTEQNWPRLFPSGRASGWVICRNTILNMDCNSRSGKRRRLSQFSISNTIDYSVKQKKIYHKYLF